MIDLSHRPMVNDRSRARARRLMVGSLAVTWDPPSTFHSYFLEMMHFQFTALQKTVDPKQKSQSTRAYRIFVYGFTPLRSDQDRYFKACGFPEITDSRDL